MIIQPATGTAFIIEDEEDFSKAERMGLEISTEARKGVGSTGVVYKITNEQEGFFPRLRHWLFADRIVQRYKEGQHVIFDKFVASDIFMRDDNGNEIKRLRTIPVDCILGTIIEGEATVELK